MNTKKKLSNKRKNTIKQIKKEREKRKKYIESITEKK